MGGTKHDFAGGEVSKIKCCVIMCVDEPTVYNQLMGILVISLTHSDSWKW